MVFHSYEVADSKIGKGLSVNKAGHFIATKPAAMPKVEYGSDENVSDRRRAWLGDSPGSSRGSTTMGRARKTAGKANTQASESVRESQGFVQQHKSQILVAAAIAGGLAVAGIVVNKVLGNKPSPTSEGGKPSPVKPKKLAARRKRSG